MIVEPVVGNMGLVPPQPGFLERILELCREHGAVSIFDEVMTGSRLSAGGAQGLFGMTPDMTCLGKIVGGGMPLAVYGGKREIMQHIAPLGAVYQAGTLSGSPLAIAFRPTSSHTKVRPFPFGPPRHLSLSSGAPAACSRRNRPRHDVALCFPRRRSSSCGVLPGGCGRLRPAARRLGNAPVDSAAMSLDQARSPDSAPWACLVFCGA